MEAAKRKGKVTKKGGSPAKKAKRSTKAADGIKKPTSAYIYFVSDYRMVLKNRNVDTSKVQEVAKLCGAAWKQMSEQERQPYQEKYMQDKKRYLSERETVDKIKGKDPNKPKRPQTAYFFFLADFRKEMAGKQLKEGQKIPTLAGERWQTMSDEQKKPYSAMVEKDKARYSKEMEQWKLTNPEPEKKKAPAKKKVPEPVESSDDDSDEESDDDDDDEEEEDDSDSD